MSKYIKIFLIIAVVLFLAGLGLSFIQSTEAQIKEEVAIANYCEKTSDCAINQSQCPFGCYIAVNKNEVARIENLVMSYKSNCVYSCIELKNVDCVNNKCELSY